MDDTNTLPDESEQSPSADAQARQKQLADLWRLSEATLQQTPDRDYAQSLLT